MILSADDILLKSHRQLFPGGETEVMTEYRRLAKLWHPDRNHDPLAKDVLAHLVAMHKAALSRDILPHKVFVREDGTSFKMEYQSLTYGEGCEIYVGGSSVAYLIGEANADLADRATARKWKFANPDMKKEMDRFLPNLVREIRLQGGRLFIFRRTPDQILMSDLIKAEGRIVSPHASWMITRMLNIACYLEYAGVSHLSIAPEFLLVSLEHHGISLVGPALYATDFGRRPKAAPRRTVERVPSLREADSEANIRIDLHLIRQTALDLLGDPSGNRIRSDPAIRPETVRWVSSAPAKTAIADYSAWEDSLGKRTFVIYPKTAQSIYAAMK